MSTTEIDSLLLDMECEAQSDPILDCGAVFGDENPVEIELGIGKGRFLIDAAQRCPSVNFVGVEWAGKYLRIAHTRCLKRKLANVRLVKAEAREFVEFFLPSASIQAFHLYFPDPWPKKRHHKRRLFNDDFVAEVVRVLIPGGNLWLATDHDEYFQVMLEVLDGCPSLRQTSLPWEGVCTNYEDKFVARGAHINRLALEKAGATGGAGAPGVL